MSWFSWVDSCPVIASTPLGSTGVRASTSSCWPVPGPARTWMDAAPPGFGVRYFSASARVIPVKVTWPMPSSPPKVARPTTVTPTGSGVRSTVRSPTFRPPLSAAPRLITTSPDAAGTRPSASRYGLSSGSSIQLPATVGGPCPPTGLPSEPTSCPAPWMLGTAAATPGVFSIRLTRFVRTGCRVPWPSPETVTTLELRTTASVPLLAPANMVSKLPRSVSPMTSVPARKATPSSTAVKVPAKRRLWARSELRLMRSDARLPLMPSPLGRRRPSGGPGRARRSGPPSGRRAVRRRGRRPRRRGRRRRGRE